MHSMSGATSSRGFHFIICLDPHRLLQYLSTNYNKANYPHSSHRGWPRLLWKDDFQETSFITFSRPRWCNKLISYGALEHHRYHAIACVRCRIQMCWWHFYYIRTFISFYWVWNPSLSLVDKCDSVHLKTENSFASYTLVGREHCNSVPQFIHFKYLENFTQHTHTHTHPHSPSRTQHDTACSPTPIGHQQTISIGWHAKSVAIHISVEHQVKLKLKSSSCRVTAETSINLNMTTMDSPSFILTVRAKIMADPMPKQDSAYILVRKIHCEYYCSALFLVQTVHVFAVYSLKMTIFLFFFFFE